MEISKTNIMHSEKSHQKISQVNEGAFANFPAINFVPFRRAFMNGLPPIPSSHAIRPLQPPS